MRPEARSANKTKFGKLRWKFGIAAGLLLALVIAIFFVGRPLLCPTPTAEQWTAKHDQHSAPQNQGAKPYAGLVLEKKKESYSGNEKTKSEIRDNFRELVCGDVKLTDFLIVLLTGLLFFAGLYQMWNAELLMKTAERAYIVGGTFHGKPKALQNRPDKPMTESDIWDMRYRPIADMFTGPYRMAIHNFGKTAGYTTKIQWGFCPAGDFKRIVNTDEFDKERCVSRLIDTDKLRPFLVGEVTRQDLIATTGNTPSYFRDAQVNERADYVGKVFFGKITYKDCFRDEHYSTFAFELTPEHANAIGKSLSDDHD